MRSYSASREESFWTPSMKTFVIVLLRTCTVLSGVFFSFHARFGLAKWSIAWHLLMIALLSILIPLFLRLLVGISVNFRRSIWTPYTYMRQSIQHIDTCNLYHSWTNRPLISSWCIRSTSEYMYVIIVSLLWHIASFIVSLVCLSLLPTGPRLFSVKFSLYYLPRPPPHPLLFSVPSSTIINCLIVSAYIPIMRITVPKK